jgi:4-amino-4-deoxy-L-arabinose transferase-like glycosyltransferase
MFVDLLHLLALMLADHVQAAMIQYGFGLLCLVAMARCCRMEGSRLAGLLAAALFLGNGVVLFELPIAYVDVAFTFFFLMAFLLAVTGLDRDSPFHLALAGLCCGVLAGTKLNGVMALASIAALVVPRVLRGGRRGLFLLALGLPCLIAVPWYVKAYIHTGNPVYPFLYDLFGGPEWNADLTRKLAEWNARIGMGKSLGDYLLLPLRVILMGGPTYGEFGGTLHPAWIVLVPASAAVAVRDRTVRRCLLASAVYFVGWSVTSQQMRFLIPVLPLLSVAAALSLVRLAERLPAPRCALVEGILPAVFAVCLTAWSWDELQEGRRLLAVYLVHGDGVRALAVPAVYGAINRLPPTSKVLFLNTNHAYFCDREFIADSVFEASQMQALLSRAETEDELRRLLEDMGITHVYFKRMDWKIDYPQSFRRYIGNPRHVRRVFQSADRIDVLFEILPAEGGR